ncbi:MAG: stage 0 sporulation family protein [Candidatus Izemoplasmatales bacterium]|nr:stage 0 sporulation family protein [Candidatus Izemoplasmatales bacterium]
MDYLVVPVQFNRVGKKYYFSAEGKTIRAGDQVVVETIRGIEIGTASEDPKLIKDNEVVSPLKPIIRVATDQDKAMQAENEAMEPGVLKRTQELVKKHQLDMKLLTAEYTLDRQKLLIYFTAEGRVDFRELVKDLANEFHIRIELRQVGARDGAKVLGGIGPCGLITCCSQFLGEFEPVSIKMAKNQNLSLNPSSISGLCGKLLCCIHYEDENYREFRKQMPKVNSIVVTPDGSGRVTQVNFFNLTAKVEFPDNKTDFYHVSKLEFREKAIDEDIEADTEDIKALEG